MTSDLIVGAGQPVGAASLTSMLLSLTGEVRARRAGTVVRVPATVDRSVRVGDIRTRYLVGYECPDIDVVQRIVPGVSEYSYRVCFEQLPGFAVDLVHRLSEYGRGWGIGVSERGRARRARTVAALAGCAAGIATALNRRRGRQADPAVLSIALHGRDGQTLRGTVTGPSSYRMTAACALSVLRVVTEEVDRVPAGVSELDRLGQDHRAIWAELSRFGIDAPDITGSTRESAPMRTGKNDRQGDQSVTGVTK